MQGTYYYQAKNKSWPSRLKKVLWWFFILLFLGVFAYASFFAFKFYSAGKKMNAGAAESSFVKTIRNIASENPTKLNSSAGNRINILLLGIAGEGKTGKNLTDTIMIASLDQENGRVAFLSLPRDLYVKIPEDNLQMKINSVYQYGISNSKNNSADSIHPVKFPRSETYLTGVAAIKKTLEKITSLKIDYYAVVNFDGFQKIIDSIGGINIMNERDIFDPRYPGPNYSYETFELSKGFHHLDGATALKYARERHNDPEGDFGRAKRQQQVLQAVKNKIFSAGTYLNVFALNDIFNALGNNISTDIKPEEIGAFLQLAKKFDTENITNVVADAWEKDSLLKVSHIFYGNTRSFVLVPRVGNWSDLQDLAQNIFSLDKIKARQNEIEKEQASALILNRSGNKALTEKIRSLLKDKLKLASVAILTEKEIVSFDKTIVLDNTGGKKIFTLDELVKKIPAKLDESGLNIVDLKQDTDFIIILGTDIVDAYQFDEDSIEEFNKAQDNNSEF